MRDKAVRKRKLGDEKENRNTTAVRSATKTRKLNSLTVDGRRETEENDGPGTSSTSTKKSPQKIMELVSLVDRKVVVECEESKPPTRKQKRVQLKQLFSACDAGQGGGKAKKTGGHSAKQKTKRKSMELLMNATDHVWAPEESVPLEEPDDEWRQVNIEAVNPLELIGRSCKVFWPLDQCWYVGCIREYNSVTKKHRVDYQDDQVEWLALVKEQIQFHMTSEQERALSSLSTETSVKPGVDVDELVLLSHEPENSDGGIGHGTVVWAKVKGWPDWPALVLGDEHAKKFDLGAFKKASVAVQFFGSCDFARLSKDKVVTFGKGVQRGYHSKCKRPAFDHGLKEVERYLKRGKLPDKMAQTQEIQSKKKSEAEQSLNAEDNTLQVDKSDVPRGFKSIHLQWKHSDRCNVCYNEEEYETNLLLQCAKCRMMVHMMCYGEVEQATDSIWLCQLCNQRIAPVCSLCPVAGGAMKRTTDGGWAHLTCAIWIPETTIPEGETMEPVSGVSSIDKGRWKLRCSVCEVPYGACIQCTNQNCAVAYHPLCARAAGFRMEILDVGGDIRFETFCAKHNQTGKREKNKNLLVTIAEPPEQDTEAGSDPSGCARSRPYSATTPRRIKQAVPYITKSAWRLSKDGDVYRSLPPTAATNELLSYDARLQFMKRSLRDRLTFGKSAIHGWGVFTKQPHQAGDMMVEYAGEIVRPVIADLREQRHYNKLLGAGTYMFKIDEDQVVDATRVGSIAHLINHSCEPNCYSRIITINGTNLIIIFAKRRLKAGEELTYDYRFTSKGEELACKCGAKNCRGSVRQQSDENEGSLRIKAPCSAITKWPCC